MVKFVKFFGITFLFVLIIVFVTLYVGFLKEGTVRFGALLFYTIITVGYGLTLWYVLHREKSIEVEQAEIEKKLIMEELERHKEELEKIKKRFEEYEKKVEEEE